MATTPTTLHGQSDTTRATSRLRVRWAAIGAAVAVTLGAGGITATHAVLESGDRSVFVPITPCRVLDTRVGNTVQTRILPLGPAERLTVKVTGSAGECLGIPNDATGVAMNVTVLNGTQPSFLAVYPSNLDSPPTVSNLNWLPGQAPTPNKVDVALSAAGAVRFYNRFGTVDVFADVFGYYVSHNHDDRYYTKAQVRKLVSGEYTCSAVDFFPSTSAQEYSGDATRRSAPVATTLYCGVQLPVGADIDRLTASIVDEDPVNDHSCTLLRRLSKDPTALGIVNTAPTSVTGPTPQVVTGVPAPAASATAQTNHVIACTTGPGAAILGATVEFTVPGPTA